MDESCWRQALIEAHPELFVRSFRGVKFSPGYPICNDGWQHIITRLAERVSRAAKGYSVRFNQILEQHGALRIHWASRSDLPRDTELAIQEAIALAEARAGCSCAHCGAEGRLFSHKSRLFTACETHARGILVPMLRGHHDAYIVRAIVDDQWTLVRCRYDRPSDSFVYLPGEPIEVTEFHNV